MRASIVSVGDELLVGQVVNTNASWLGSYLTGMGVVPARIVAVGDDIAEIESAIAASYESCELVVVTGGLGPTHDDVTREAVAQFLGTKLVMNERWIGIVRRRFEQRGLSFPERNVAQGLVPAEVEMLPNPVGTAPGFWKTWEAGSGRRILAVLPGVPEEMKTLMRDKVRPRLEPEVRNYVRHVTLRTTGIGESHLQELLAPVVSTLPSTVKCAYLPSPFGVRVRLTETVGRNQEDDGELDETVSKVEAIAGEYIYGRNDDTLEAVVGVLLRERGLTVATAESCTGGAISDRLTDVSGASNYVVGGIVAYSNAVKVGVLDVDPEMIERDGAVSRESALQMARGVRVATGGDVGLSATGILGPSGGTPDKPVGTVWIACVGPGWEEARPLRLGSGRLKNKERTVAAALDLLRRALLR